MSAPSLTLAQIEAMAPCKGRFADLAPLLPQDGPITAAMAIEAGATIDDLLWAARKIDRRPREADIERRIRLWLADCVAHVLPVFERGHDSDIPRRSIVLARLSARGKIAGGVKNDMMYTALSDVWALDAKLLHDNAGVRTWFVLKAVRGILSRWLFSEATSVTCAASVSAGLAHDAEQKWQLERLVAWLSDPEPEDWPLPERATHIMEDAQ